MKAIQTGFRDLDSLTGGFSPGELVILGGESRAGRSAFALNTALYTAQHGEAAAFFSFESTTELVRDRLISILTSVPLWDLRCNNLSREDAFKVIRIASNPIWSRLGIFGSANGTVEHIRDCVRQLSKERVRKSKSPVSLVVADPHRLMGAVSPAREEQRHRQLATNIISLKRMARDLSVTVLLVSGLERGFEVRDGKPPVLANLEVPEVIESYADKVLLLHRDSYSSLGSVNKGSAEILVVKTRNGLTGKVRLALDRDCGSFTSLLNRKASKER